MREYPIEQPTVYIIAGPNGAGKTTFATKFLPDFVDCREFLNADLIAAGLSPFAPESQSIHAGKLMLLRIKELKEKRVNFGFETTLSGRSYFKLLQGMKTDGYRIELFFLWIPSEEIAVNRVANRVRQGGHHIPEQVIRRRYQSGILNLLNLYHSLLDSCWLYDASTLPPIVASRIKDGNTTIFHNNIHRQIEQSMKELIR